MKKFHVVIFAITLIMFNCKTFDEQKATLTDSYDDRISESIQPIDSILNKSDALGFKGISKYNLEKYVVQNYAVNYKQRLFQDYINHKITKSRFIQHFKPPVSSLSDTLKLSRKSLKNEFNVLSGIDRKGNRLIVVDLNNDKNFANDDATWYSKTQQQRIVNEEDSITRSFPLITLNYERLEKGLVKAVSTKVKIFPFKDFYDSYDDSLAKTLETVIQFSKVKIANLNILGKKYTVYLRDLADPIGDFVKKDYIEVRLFDANSKILGTAPDWKPFGSIFPIDNNNCVKLHLTGDNKLSYSVYNLKDVAGISSGQNFPSHTFYNYKTGKRVMLDFKHHDYTIIDFWGSWCGPCKEALPHMASLNKKFSDKKRVQFLGIAYDQKSKSKVIDSLLKANKVNYQTFIDDKALKAKSFEKTYHVYVYPTLLIVNRDGTVIMKANSAEQVDKRLAELLSK